MLQGMKTDFYVYAADESTAPDTLGKLLELYGLSQNIELNYVTKMRIMRKKEELCQIMMMRFGRLCGRSDAKT